MPLLLLIRHGENGLFVPPADPSALREAIEYLWNHPKEADRMGREGRKFIEQHHTLDQWVNSVRQVVEEVIAEKAQSKQGVDVPPDGKKNPTVLPSLSSQKEMPEKGCLETTGLSR